MQKAERSVRDDTLDVARGIGIVLVVAAHVMRGLVDANIVERAVWAVPDYVIYSFHMPLFFVLAGLTAPKSIQRGVRSFTIGKVETILYPYLVWSFIQGGISVAMSRWASSPLGLDDLISIPWRPIQQFWFLYALFVLQVVYGLTRRAGAFLPTSAVLFIVAAALKQNTTAFNILHFSLFYAIGLWAGRNGLPSFTGPASGSSAKIGLVLIAFAGMVAAAFVAGETYLSLAAFPAAILGISAVMLSSRRISTMSVGHVAAYLGRLSLPIYVMHILAASGVRILLAKAGFGVSPAVFILVGIVLGLGLPILAEYLMRKLGLLPLFGLAPFRSRRRGARDGIGPGA